MRRALCYAKPQCWLLSATLLLILAYRGLAPVTPLFPPNPSDTTTPEGYAHRLTLRTEPGVAQGRIHAHRRRHHREFASGQARFPGWSEAFWCMIYDRQCTSVG